MSPFGVAAGLACCHGQPVRRYRTCSTVYDAREMWHCPPSNGVVQLITISPVRKQRFLTGLMSYVMFCSRANPTQEAADLPMVSIVQP